ncbi:hypothetical protein [Pseudomonas zeae]
MAHLKAILITRNGTLFAHNADITINENDAGRSDIYFPAYGTKRVL